MLSAFFILISLAIVLMIVGLFMAFQLRKTATGGVIGKVVNTLIGLIVLFMLGYVVAPFMPRLPTETILLLMGIVFFFGAVYVVLVLWLIKRLVRQVKETLES
ncbi:MAG: hypothetical protein GY854_22010 [Deltaproteobacteria bacterium]|nr:hypothetical protein [Deltaproteobacteria bacterium]